MFNFLKRWFGYEKVAIVEVDKPKNGHLYDHEKAEIRVGRKWRRFYNINYKSIFWNVKNYVKYRFNLNYVKFENGQPRFQPVYHAKRYVRKKNDFAILPQHLIDYANKPVSSRFKPVGTVDRPKNKN